MLKHIFRRSSAVEQVTVNHLVTGSNPVVGAICKKNVQSGVLFASIPDDGMRSLCSVAKRTGKSCRRNQFIKEPYFGSFML